MTRWCRHCQNVLKEDEHHSCTLCRKAKWDRGVRINGSLAPTFQCAECGQPCYNGHSSGLCYSCGRNRITSQRRRIQRSWGQALT